MKKRTTIDATLNIENKITWTDATEMIKMNEIGTDANPILG